MSLPRHHIHLACVAEDLVLRTAQDDLAVFAENRAYLTRDLLVSRTRSANYSWRCINDCDVVVIMIGGSYGSTTNPSGVSQLHLSYSNARTTKKPMVILIHRAVQHTTDRHLMDFVKLVESQESDNITYFDESRNLLSILEATVGKLLLEQNRPPQVLTAEIATLPKLAPTVNNLKCGNLDEIRAKKHISHSLRPALLLDNAFDVGCTAHAFQGGTLFSVEFDFKMTWRTVLRALADLGVPFSSQGLTRCLNECIDKQYAHDLILQQYPEVHAVSRHQVVKSDALWIQDELQLAGHIVPIDPNGTSTLWSVSPSARYAIDSPPPPIRQRSTRRDS
ncbi:MAG: DUF4062 domain-containing protein [Moraxella sp.]|nr:DUF4062 domain-containing protein [Moraxella sp.]